MTKIGLGEKGRWVSCGESDLSWIKQLGFRLSTPLLCVTGKRQLWVELGLFLVVACPAGSIVACLPVCTQCLCVLWYDLTMFTLQLKVRFKSTFQEQEIWWFVSTFRYIGLRSCPLFFPLSRFQRKEKLDQQSSTLAASENHLGSV